MCALCVRVVVAVVPLALALVVNGQTPSTTGPVPPLQWIRLNPSGPPPPALMYPAMGYDTDLNQVVIFGGETSGGLQYDKTHLLDFRQPDAPIWTVPTPPATLNARPPGRSRAGHSLDLPASYRRGLLVYGGQGQTGPLNDIWEYHYGAQFWYQLEQFGEQPPARWGGLSGGDPPGTINADLTTSSFYAGGRNADTAFSWDEFWLLQVNGTIAENFQDAKAYWTRIPASQTENFSPKTGQAGTVMRLQDTAEYSMITFGGCDGVGNNATCAEQDAHALINVNGARGNYAWSQIPTCPSGRFGGVLAPNYNPVFPMQLFLLLGTTDSEYYDNEELNTAGEIGVLDLDQGVWSRVLPSCDPESTPPCPVPREGAGVVSSRNSIAGGNLGSSDVIIFGGRDRDGNYLNDLWLLRATNATIRQTNQTDWGELFGDGELQSGIHQNGRGVTIQFLDECVSKKTPDDTDDDDEDPSTPGDNPNSQGDLISSKYETGTLHKALAGVSVAFLMPALVIHRLGSPSAHPANGGSRPWILLIGIVVGIVAWILGTVGFIFSFISVRLKETKLQKRQDQDSEENEKIPFLPTPHSVAGFILFMITYFIIPAILLLLVFRIRFRKTKPNPKRNSTIPLNTSTAHSTPDQERKDPTEETHALRKDADRSSSHDKIFPRQSLSVSGAQTPGLSDHEAEDDGDPVGAGERIRLRKSPFAPSAFWNPLLWGKGWPTHRQRIASEPDQPERPLSAISSPDPNSTPPESGFVVLNRNKGALGGRSVTPMSHFDSSVPANHHYPNQHTTHHGNHGQSDRENSAWLYLRRNLNYVGDVDYMISKLGRRNPSGGPGGGERHSMMAGGAPSLATYTAGRRSVAGSRMGARAPRQIALKYPALSIVITRITAHLVLLALIIFCAVAMVTRGGQHGRIIGAVFVVWCIICYAGIGVLAWSGRPQGSVLVVVISRLRGQQRDGEEHDGTEYNENETNTNAGIGEEAEMGVYPPSERSPFGTTSGTTGYRPPFRPLNHSGSGQGSNGGQHSGSGQREAEDDDDDDEDVEEEIGRRDISIVTVPKRQLFVANAGPL